MPKTSKSGYYAVPSGREPGIYSSWADCEAQVRGFPNAIYKKFNTEAEAIAFIAAKSSTSVSRDIVPVVPWPSSVSSRVIEPAQDEKDCDIVYCDGACKGNGQAGSIAGVGVWWGHGDPRNISERCPGDQTNNRAELIAIIRILETAPHLKRRLLIKTDSNYSIQCVTSWVFNWMRNGFLTADGKQVKNRALIKYLAALLRARRKTSQTVEFKRVRGHVGIEGNEAADQLANLGAAKPMIPEPDWEELEKQVLQSLKPVEPVKVVDDDLEAYVDGLLNDDELTESANINVGDVETPVPELTQQHWESGKDVAQLHTSVSLVLHNASPSLTALRPSDGITAPRSTSKLQSGGSSIPALAQGLQSDASKKPATVISKEELEVYVTCLLSDDELSTLGKAGVFDSDF